MDIKYAIQIQRNYDMFKQAIGKLIQEKAWSDEEEDYLYDRAKAELYNIEWDYTIYDPIGLKQAIEEYEWIERKERYNNDRDYYNRLGVR